MIVGKKLFVSLVAMVFKHLYLVHDGRSEISVDIDDIGGFFEVVPPMDHFNRPISMVYFRYLDY